MKKKHYIRRSIIYWIHEPYVHTCTTWMNVYLLYMYISWYVIYIYTLYTNRINFDFVWSILGSHVIRWRKAASLPSIERWSNRNFKAVENHGRAQKTLPFRSFFSCPSKQLLYIPLYKEQNNYSIYCLYNYDKVYKYTCTYVGMSRNWVPTRYFPAYSRVIQWCTVVPQYDQLLNHSLLSFGLGGWVYTCVCVCVKRRR